MIRKELDSKDKKFDPKIERGNGEKITKKTTRANCNEINKLNKNEMENNSEYFSLRSRFQSLWLIIIHFSDEDDRDEDEG